MFGDTPQWLDMVGRLASPRVRPEQLTDVIGQLGESSGREVAVKWQQLVDAISNSDGLLPMAMTILPKIGPSSLVCPTFTKNNPLADFMVTSPPGVLTDRRGVQHGGMISVVRDCLSDHQLRAVVDFLLLGANFSLSLIDVPLATSLLYHPSGG
ncbi:hypothetical protein Salat_2611500 [Sesamum alatum]|uniref:Uncharacterized protein n=1 Tax=Sesamum alatum TaxID=300844 RepID=A0AAE1XNF3_9LAMI|nr:hypothetical protein Salat_2611500 [Sesamum alatum]